MVQGISIIILPISLPGGTWWSMILLIMKPWMQWIIIVRCLNLKDQRSGRVPLRKVKFRGARLKRRSKTLKVLKRFKRFQRFKMFQRLTNIWNILNFLPVLNPLGGAIAAKCFPQIFADDYADTRRHVNKAAVNSESNLRQSACFQSAEICGKISHEVLF